MSTGYEITIFVPAHPAHHASILRMLELHKFLANIPIAVWPPESILSEPEWVLRRRSKPRKSPASQPAVPAEPATQDGTGGAATIPTAPPAADPDKLPSFLDRKVPRP